MTIEDFVEKAIQGGWDSKNEWGSSPHDIPIERILLDPKAWQAVARVTTHRGEEKHLSHPVLDARIKATASRNMYRMIDALAEGGTIESFLETLK